MEKERTSPWLILFRVVFTAALIACIMFIFRNSLENGAQSSARSQAVMQLVNSALAKVHLGPLSEHLIRKLAHFSEFALEGFLLMLCIRVYTKHFVRHMSWPLLGGMTTALMDETIQLHSPNRTSSVVDVWIDMSGVVAGLLFALIILLIVLLLFGGKKIPELMRGLGKGVKSFKDGVNEAKEEINKAQEDLDKPAEKK